MRLLGGPIASVILRIVFVNCPLQRVVLDVGADAVKVSLVANDMLMVVRCQRGTRVISEVY